jgi:hypothetical protein
MGLLDQRRECRYVAVENLGLGLTWPNDRAEF